MEIKYHVNDKLAIFSLDYFINFNFIARIFGAVNHFLESLDRNLLLQRQGRRNVFQDG